ncbi:MAG: 1,4-dihydroxy-2-naphthoate polyprenyltransferase [Cytophagia bacterium]|nr:1,4-dihydroxy-2-naphthoate polyprenyltransferase [Cytophagia bacterium]
MKAWLHAFRLRTLPLAISCIGMGSFLAAAEGFFRLDIFLLAVLTTIFLQILSNLANDYGDAVSGIDSDERKGPKRAVQSGAISKTQMRNAMVLFVMLSLVSGITLLLVAFGLNWSALLFFFGLGLLSIVAAIAYTVGKRPYGYVGLGDISVLLFFGIVGVGGSYYLFTQTINWMVLLPALSCGLFSIGVLNINNIRDIESDQKAGKYSIPVRIGKQNAAIYHIAISLVGVLSAVVFVILNYVAVWQLLFLLTSPFLYSINVAVLNKPSDQLDPYLKKMAISTLLFVLLFGIGLLVS